MFDLYQHDEQNQMKQDFREIYGCILIWQQYYNQIIIRSIETIHTFFIITHLVPMYEDIQQLSILQQLLLHPQNCHLVSVSMFQFRNNLCCLLRRCHVVLPTNIQRYISVHKLAVVD